MNLYYINPQSYNNLSTYDHGLLNDLKKYGIDATYYCHKKIDIKYDKNIKIKKYFTYNNSYLIVKLYSYIISIIRVNIDLCKSEKGIIHISWFKLYIIDNLIYYLFSFFHKHKIIFTFHNIYTKDKKNLSYKIIAFFLKSFSLYIFHEPIILQEATNTYKLNKNKCIILDHGLIPLKRKGKFRSKKIIHNILKKYKKIFLFIGNGSKYKGFDLLLDAWKDFSFFFSISASLIVAGKQNNWANKTYLKKNLNKNNNIFLLNYFISDNELLYLIKKCNSIVMPYRSISQSGVLMTALTYRKRILISKMGIFKQISKYKNICTSFDINTKKEKNNLIKALIRESKINYLTPYSTNSTWKNIHSKYSWKLISKNYSSQIKMLQKK